MKAVSDRLYNPFGLEPPCEGEMVVPGYGDPAADFHLIGERPEVNGGLTTGVPFTETTGAMQLQAVLTDVGLFHRLDGDRPSVNNLFMNYLVMCTGQEGASAIREFDRFFDAELRAVNAHILMPVGKRASDHVIRTFTTRYRKEPRSMVHRHAREIRGRGFLVVPIADPDTWSGTQRDELRETLAAILASDYRQTKGVATLVG